MKNWSNRKRNPRKGTYGRIAAFSAIISTMLMSMVFASGTTPTLNFDFDFSQMFTWTNSILSAMMPVVYITLGISLAFVILRALKSAFN